MEVQRTVAMCFVDTDPNHTLVSGRSQPPLAIQALVDPLDESAKAFISPLRQDIEGWGEAPAIEGESKERLPRNWLKHRCIGLT